MESVTVAQGKEGAAELCDGHLADGHLASPGRHSGSARPNPVTKIASIEAFLPNVPSSLPAAEITLSPRPYRRHTLVGLNVWALQLFGQFPRVLGMLARNVQTPSFRGPLDLRPG